MNPPDPGGENFIREGRCTQQEGLWTTLWPPVSLVYLGTVLKAHGHEVRVRDCPAEGIDRDALTEIIRSFAPGAVIWSTGTPSIESDLALASIVKGVQPAAFTAVFGTHASVLDADCMKQSPDLDAIIRNEPEMTALELVGALSSGAACAGVEGLTFRASQCEIVRNPSRPFIRDPDTLPFPDWGLINTGNYRLPLKGDPFLIVVPFRGCPFPCSFCTAGLYYGKGLRLRDTRSVLNEIRAGMERFGVRDFFFWAETFTLDRAFVMDLCGAIRESGLRFRWVCNSRVDTADEELLKAMAGAGCWMISFGIESSNPEILKTVNKNTTPGQTRKAVALAKGCGMLVSGHVIFGLPGETVDTAEETLRFVKGLCLDFAQFYCAVPFPGTPLYNMALESGWITGGSFACFRQERAAMSLPSISPQQVERIRERAVREFYFRPAAMLKLLGLMNARAVWNSLRGALKFLRRLF